MTIENIKNSMNPIYYNHWIRLSETEDLTEEKKEFYLKKALKEITYEIEQGLLIGIEYEAEKALLTRLLTKSFIVRNNKWTESKFDPNKRQVELFDLINGKMEFKGIGQF